MAWDDTAQIIQEEAADATKVVIELIQQRLKEIPNIKEQLIEAKESFRLLPDGSRRKAADLKNLLKTQHPKLYRAGREIDGELKNLNRALGELFTAEGKQTYLLEDGLFEDLFSGEWDLDGLDLSKRLAAFEGKLSGYTDAIKSGIKRFTVGHHQHLASLRELALEAKKRADPKWWAEYTRLLADRGFEIGDKGILRLARQGHKILQAKKTGELNIDGFLKDLGVTDKTPGFKQLYEATKKIMAHAGGTGGVKIPPKFALLSPEKALNASLPILEVERAQSQGGELFTKVIRNWSNKIKEGGGEVTEEAINKLTRLTNRIGKTLIGTTDGKPNLSFEQFDEKGRLARNVVLEQLAEIENDAVSSGFMNSAMDAAADLAEQNKYESMAGPVKIIQKTTDNIFNTDVTNAKNLVKNSIKGIVNTGSDFLQTPTGRVIGATTTGFVKNVSKASAGIDPLQFATGSYKAITAPNPADKVLGAKDAVEGGLGMGAWFAPGLLNVLAPITTGSIIGGLQAGGAERIRKITDDLNYITSFGTNTAAIGQQNPFESVFKKKNDDDDEINETE